MASRSARGARNRGYFKKSYKDGFSNSQEQRGKKEETLNESSPVIQAFRIFQEELDNRNDRNERIVKLSRDITIESKRIIFLLQRCAGLENKQDVLNEAATKFEELYKSKFFPLALELEGQDPYQYLRAYSPGLQEYIEAVTFYHYLQDENLVGVDKVQTDLIFSTNFKTPETKLLLEETLCTSSADDIAIQSQSNLNLEKDTSLTAHEGALKGKNSVVVPVPPSEYMLGVADFTGELMRMAINSVGAGDLDTPSLVLKLMRLINCAFNSFGNIPRELRQKARVLSQSLQKVERACYTLRVRGSEIPTHMLVDVFTSGSMPADSYTDELDEQFD